MKALSILIASLVAGSQASAEFKTPVITSTNPPVIYKNPGEYPKVLLKIHGTDLEPSSGWQINAGGWKIWVKCCEGGPTFIRELKDGQGGWGGPGGLMATLDTGPGKWPPMISLVGYPDYPVFHIQIENHTHGPPPWKSNWFKIATKPYETAGSPSITKLEPSSITLGGYPASHYAFKIHGTNLNDKAKATVASQDCVGMKVDVPGKIVECTVPPALRKPGKLNVQLATPSGYSAYKWLEMIGAPQIVSVKPSKIYKGSAGPPPGSSANQNVPDNSAQQPSVTKGPQPAPKVDLTIAFTGSKPTLVEIKPGQMGWSKLNSYELNAAETSLHAKLDKYWLTHWADQNNPIVVRLKNSAGEDVQEIPIEKPAPKGSGGGGPPTIKIPPKSEVQPPGPGPMGDPQILKQVQTGLAGRLGATGRGLNVSVVNGVVTLNGQVKTPAEKQNASVVALKIAGVKSVQNKLQVAAEKR